MIKCFTKLFQIPCFNTMCRHINNVPTGKRKDKVWDANVKLAAGKVNYTFPTVKCTIFFMG